jgi:hypothetical protein
MLSGATFRAPAMAGTAVFRMVVSNDSMKNATATSHGSNRLLDVSGELTTGRGMARAYVIQAYHPPATNSQ